MFTSLNISVIGITAPLEEALELARSNNFEGLDLSLPELSQEVEKSSVQAVKDLFASAQVRAGGWGLPLDFRSSAETFREGLNILPRYAALAQEMGSPWCYTWILPFSDERDYKTNMDFHVQRLRLVAQILADHGCRFGLEFVGAQTLRAGHRYEFISTIADALDLGQQLGIGNSGLLLDSFHWYTSHGTTDDLQQLSAEQIVYVHVNDAVAGRGPDEQIDNQRLLPGASGVIDIVSFLQALKRMNYEGPVVVEPFNAALARLPYTERVQATRASLTKIWQEAGL